MLLEQLAVGRPARPRAQRQEDLVDITEVRACLFDDATKLLEGLALSLKHLANASIERQAAEVGTPRDPDSSQVSIKRPCERGGIARKRLRIASVGAGHHAQAKRNVRYRSRQRALRRDADEWNWRRRHRHEADSRTKRDDVVEVRRIAERAAEVAAIGDRQHAGGHRHCGAAARASGGLGAIVRIERRPIDPVVGLRAHPKLGDVGLADRNRAGTANALDHHRVRIRHQVLENRRALALRKSYRRLQILERRWQAMQRSNRPAIAERTVRPIGQRQACTIIEFCDDGVESGIET